MNRKLTGLVAAVVLALLGTLLLVGYVNSAEARALSGEELVEVLVVTDTITAGTKGSEIADRVEIENVPSKVRAEGAINDLDQVKDLIVTVDLMPGEQLVAGRFAETASREGVPDGLLEVTVRLDAERALGGRLRPGDKVAVISSFEPFELDATGIEQRPGAPTKTPNTTHLILHKVLVTAVQIGDGASIEDEDEDGTPDSAPSGTMLVTLAVNAEAVQRIVFTAEHGYLWLSLEPDDAPEPELVIETRGSVDR